MKFALKLLWSDDIFESIENILPGQPDREREFGGIMLKFGPHFLGFDVMGCWVRLVMGYSGGLQHTE